MRAARTAVVSLLAVEGIGAVVFAVLIVVVGGSITPGLIPWGFAVTPLLFGVFALVVAVLYWRGHPSSTPLALVAQTLVSAGAIAGLSSGRHPLLLIALVMGIGGIALALAGVRQQREV